MKINWKLRIQNKVTLSAILLGVLTLVYQVLGILGIVPSVPQNEFAQVIAMVIDLLVLLGVVVDPTTAGVSDSTRALDYDHPNEE